MKQMSSHVPRAHCASTRRRFLAAAAGVCAAARTDSIFAQVISAGSASLTKQQRDGLSVVQVIDELRKGNERFRAGKLGSRDYRDQQRTTATGQFPAAVVLGCIDSRAPAEIIFDVGIGDTFNVRVAGNVVNDDLLGSLEFACAVAGAKVVLVIGHTACGAIKGAIDDVEMGNLTGLLARIKPAISATKFRATDRAKRRLSSTPWRGRTSSSGSRTSGGGVRFWTNSKRREPSGSSAPCTTWRLAWWR